MSDIKFYEKYYDPLQLNVQWNLGNVCNYTCEYCPRYLHSGSVDWISLKKIKDVLLKIKEEFSHRSIRVEFLGGEVTLWREFPNLLQFCRDQNLKTMIFSNGSRTIRFWEDNARNLDEIILTFHPLTTDKIHFENVIKTLVDNNAIPIIHISMVKSLFNDLIEYGNYLKNKFPISVDKVLMMDKEHKKNFNGYFYDYSKEEIESIINNDTGSMFYIFKQDEIETEYSINEIRFNKLNNFNGYTCGIDIPQIVIDYRGNVGVSLCNQKPKSNIFAEDWNKVLKPTICKAEVCKNPNDIRIPKIKFN